MDLDMYIVPAGTPATDVASATRVRRRSDTADRDDESRRRTRPRVATPPPRASLAERLLLRVVTLCSGIEAVIQGYENLRAPPRPRGCLRQQQARPTDDPPQLLAERDLPRLEALEKQ